ncbi:EF-hand domain-containing protein [Bradyrhizobium sp. CER78]|uniref:EF-hand domain-containing protein n=1 Tax=Bradyrhizobium sp. CER78 TaxID=3039162 RepID=UPI0024477D77|nr:EF-hand domain-containing protein [Bradyrhizobium sp. CER78]MDH2385401.1 EF-hand domain-containing protein [Bradyrhizobium sp. CER78]
MSRKHGFALATVCSVLFIGQAHAQPADRRIAPNQSVAPNQYLVARVQAGATLARYLQSLRTELLRLDANGNGAIDTADADLLNAIAGANFRSNAASPFINADLDGDGVVTESELRQKLGYELRLRGPANLSFPPRSPADIDEQISQEVRRLMAADTDGDGRVTWNEIIDYAKRQNNYTRNSTSAAATSIRQLLPLAPNGGTSVSLVEIEAAAAAVFAAVDSDDNGTISQDELSEARSRAERTLREEKTVIDCGLPAASERSKVVLLGTYETNALSSVALGSQDSLTGAGTIVVEPGDQPLYLLIASYQPIIWRFEGAVERIERVVITTTQTGINKYAAKDPPWAGVTGLAADRVSFPHQSGCFGYFTDAPSLDSAKAAATIKQQIKKDVDVTAGLQRVTGFQIPSGKADTSESYRIALLAKPAVGAPTMGPDTPNPDQKAATGDVERNFRQLTPGGLIEIDAVSVVTSTTAVPYEVRPQEAGLVQLMQSGALTRNQRGEFLIHKQMRFPTALVGRHAARFLLLRGVPMPEGDAGGSLVVSEETGEAIEKRR